MTNFLIHRFIRNADNVKDSRVREAYGVLSGAVGLACNLVLFAAKLVIGLVSGAISIAADAVNGVAFDVSVKRASDFVKRCIQRSIELDIPKTDGVCFEEFLTTLK